MHQITEGTIYITVGEVVFAFAFFLIVMTTEDVFKMAKPFIVDFCKKRLCGQR
jgi:hypothetical protein